MGGILSLYAERIVLPLRIFVGDLLDFIYPPLCLLCHQRLDNGEDFVCPNCSSLLKPSARLTIPAEQAGSQLLHPCWFTQSTAFFSYTPELQKIIHAFKYQGLSRLDAFFEKEILKRWEGIFLEGDCLVPVPLHSARLRERGFNQSEVLGRLFSRHIGLPCDAGILERVRYTEQQAKLNAEERRRNVQGAFRVRSRESLMHRHLVLVDDVLTTGSTLNECARVLVEAGASRIDVLTLARVE